jgi:hypothetical protein
MKKILNKYSLLFVLISLFPFSQVSANTPVGSVTEYSGLDNVVLQVSTDKTSYVESLDGQNINITASIYKTFNGNEDQYTSAKITGILSTANRPEITNAVGVSKLDFGEISYVATTPTIFSKTIKISTGVNVYYLYVKSVLNTYDIGTGRQIGTSSEINTSLKIIIVPNDTLIIQTDANPKSVQPGQMTNLTWKTIGATRCFCNYPADNIRSSKLYKIEKFSTDDERRVYDQDQSSPLEFFRKEVEKTKSELDWGNYDLNVNTNHVPENGMVDCYTLNNPQKEDFRYDDETNLVNGGVPMSTRGNLYVPMSKTGEIKLSCDSFSDLGYPTDNRFWEYELDLWSEDDLFYDPDDFFSDIEDKGITDYEDQDDDYGYNDYENDYEPQGYIDIELPEFGGASSLDGDEINVDTYKVGDDLYNVGDKFVDAFEWNDYKDSDINDYGDRDDNDYDNWG